MKPELGVDSEVVRALIHDEVGNCLTVGLSDGATFEVAPDAPEAADLVVGGSVGAERRAALELAAERKTAARSALELLARRAYPRDGLRTKLLGRGLSEPAVDAVLEQCERQGLVDDLHFAMLYCRDQIRRRPVGRRWLRSQLRQKSISSDHVAAALDATFSEFNELALAKQALGSRKYSVDEPKGRARAVRFLASRGFPDSLARRLILDGLDDDGECGPD